MKYLLYLFTLCVCLMFLVGCGHNGFVYQNADVWNIGYNQNTQQIGIQRFNGELLTGGSRENTTISAELSKEADAKNGYRSGRINNIKYSTGIQINGYTVDLAKANPDFAAKVLVEMQKAGKTTKYFLIKDNKLLEVTQEEFNAEKTEKLKIDGENQTVTAE